MSQRKSKKFKAKPNVRPVRPLEPANAARPASAAHPGSAHRSAGNASPPANTRQLGNTASSRGQQSGRQAESDPAAESRSLSAVRTWSFILAAVLIPMTLWAYWPTFIWMEDQWRNEPDYSHGYLIIPLALLVLYHRRDLFPGVSPSIAWGGFSMLLAAIALRVAGRMAYMDFLDGWTLVLWVGGIIWIFGGWPMLRWAAPAVAFLVLLVPLPYQAESLLSWRLQGLSTALSVGALQTLGFPAISEGHTIWLDDQQMLVEEACSGLRIFVGMAAMGYLFAVLARRAWIDKWVIIAAALPIAIFVNVVRVTTTIMAFHWLSPDAAKSAHDFIGLLMILLGALLLAAVKTYWEHLYRPFEISLELKGLTSLPATAAVDGRH